MHARTKSKALLAATATLAVMAPAIAMAHPGHLGPHAGLLAGLLHPLTGLDHLLAMLAAGLWIRQQEGDARWALPTTFLAAILGGAALAGLGVQLPGVELGIAGSVLALGVLVASAKALPLRLAAPLAALFAVCHGYAHVAELGATASAATYTAGFMATTAAGIAAGVGLGALFERGGSARVARVAGALVAMAGVGFMATTLGI